MMTKKDFKELAEFVAKYDLTYGAITWICEFCVKSNPRFDKGRFQEYVRRIRANEDLKGLK